MAKISNDIGFNSKELTFFQIIVVLLFLGRAWQGLFWDLPLRAFFWSQSLLEGFVVHFLGRSWQDYATDVEGVDAFINGLNQGLGYFWLLCALAAALVHLRQRWAAWLLYLGSFSLLLLAVLYWLEMFMAWGQFFEYSLQVWAPIGLVHMSFMGKNTLNFRWIARIMTAIAFFCHGLYAYGYYPQPGPWMQWCMDMFFIRPDENAKFFLSIMGVLDFVAALCLLLPLRWLYLPALWYCIVWGTMTALARLSSNFYWDFPLASLHQWVFEVLYRLVHGAVPLLLWLWERRRPLG